MNLTVPQSLRRAGRHWLVGGVLHYGALATVVAGAGCAGAAWWHWPAWLPAATVAIVAVGMLLDAHWRPRAADLCRRLDARYPQLQDSSHLLLCAPETLSPVAQLQRWRTSAALGQLLDSGALRRFRPHWHRSPVVNAAGACLGLLLFFAVEQLPQRHTADPVTAHKTANSAPPLALREAVTQIAPPPYTGRPAQAQALQISAPAQSRITWQVTLNTPVDGLTMLAAQRNFAFTAEGPLPSRRWSLARTVTDTDFYQLSADRAGAETLLPEMHNIDITPDRAPAFEFQSPRDNVTVMNLDRDHRSALLQVSVDVRDDFAVAGTDLLITLASGSGENVRFRNDRIALSPAGGDERRRHYRFAIPVERYDIEPGDELYWFLQARDNRAPNANVSKSQHFILRWPQEEIFGLSDAEGMAIKVLPEYFRSQRQLIIDTEALLGERERISDADFRKRSESLAYEQNLLRMRYGRFLGEEDSAMEHHDTGEDHGAGDSEDHDGPARQQPREFGDASGVVEAAGHQHDSAENATLFDPQTKELLRSALNAMWSARRELSIIEPRASLPHQHTALRFIKEVQQATRIYLQRVGFEPPPLDETRRLSGERDAVAPPQVSAARDGGERQALLELLQRVRAGENPGEADIATLHELTLVREQPQMQVQLSKALRLLQQQPDCAECRRRLTALLYQLTPQPGAQPTLPWERAASGGFVHWLGGDATDSAKDSGVRQ